MSRRPTPPVTLPEYERLFRTIHAVLESEDTDLGKARLFFAVTGAYLLKRHHKLGAACPVAGGAGYNLQPHSQGSLLLGYPEGNSAGSDGSNFHCWVEADGWVIDLMAPLFNEIASVDGMVSGIPRFMFQKPAMAEVKTVSLETPGAHLHVPNDRLTTDLMKAFAEDPVYSELVRVCDQWYARPPKKISPRIGIADQAGATKEISLSPLRISGVW